MTSKRFPKLPDVSDDKPAKFNAKKPASQSFTDLTNNSSFSLTRNTFSEQDSDDLLNWIDGLKNRASNLFEKQRNELVQLRKEAHREQLRQKYREHIDSTSFDKLGEFLEKTQTQSGIGHGEISEDVKNRGYGSNSASEIGSVEENSQDYSLSEKEEEEAGNDEDIHEFQYPGSNQFARGSQNLANRELAELARAAEYEQEEEDNDDDIVEILSDESAVEQEESEAQDEESEEEIAEEIDVSEELIPSEEEAEEEEEEEDYYGEEIEENEAISATSNAQFARPYPVSSLAQNQHQGVSFHVQNGRPRLSDIPYNYSSNISSYRQNTNQEIEEGDEEDEEAEEVEEDNYMESEDLNEISDNLDAVESKYSDEFLEDDVERELENRNYSESEKESYYSQVEEQQSEGAYSREQYAESEIEKESYDEDENTDDDEAENEHENKDSAHNQLYGVQHAEVKVRSISPSANLFAQENVTFQEVAEMEEREKEEFVVLSDGSSSPPHAEAETSFHNFSDEADNIQSEDENQENSDSSSEAEISENAEKADAEMSSKMSGSVSDNQDGNEASSPENAELSQFLSQLQDESLNNNLFANLAQEALGAAHTEADFDDEINAALQEGAEKLLAEQQADAESFQKNLEQAPKSPDLKAHNLVDGADQENEQSHVSEIEPEIATEVEMENVPENISKEESPKSPEIALPPTSPRLLSFKTIVEEDPKTVLKQLKETEKKFNIKLDAVEKLTSEIGEVSDQESARNSPPEFPESSFYDAEVHEENIIPDAGTEEVEETNEETDEEKMEETDIEKMEENEDDSRFEESPVPSQQDSPDLLPKPEVPILEDIEGEGEDEEMVDSSTAESDQSAEIGEDMESYVVVVEPVAEEDVLTVYDEFTEVEQADILAPSEIEEPVAEETVADAVSASKVALEFVSEEGEEASINPSEIIEPLESAKVDVAVVETFEEVLDFAVPTSIVELESMRNTPVSSAAFTAEEVDSEREAAEVGLDDLQTEISGDKETGEKAEKEEDVSPESLEKVAVSEVQNLDNTEESESESESKPAFEVVERSEVLVEEPVFPATENDITDEEENTAAGAEDSETVGSSNPETSPLENSADNVAQSPISRLFGKRKLEDADTSSSPVKKLKKAFSKLNPFNWRLSEGPSLKQEIVESTENEGTDNANAEGEQVIPAPEESAPLPSEFYLESFDYPEQKHVSVGDDLDDVNTQETIESSPNLDETEGVNETVVESADENLAENNEEDSTMDDAPKVDEQLDDSVRDELPDAKSVSGLSQEVKEDSTLAHDIADENMEIEPETFVTEPAVVDVAASMLENEAENIDIDSEHLHQNHQPEIPEDADMDEETPVVRERTILLTVPPLPRPKSFMRIAQANLEDLENDMQVDDEHSNLQESEVLENEASVTGKLPTFVQPVSEIAAYIDEAVTLLVEENDENLVNQEEDEQTVHSPNVEGDFAKEAISPIDGESEDGKVESSTGALCGEGQAEILSKNNKSEDHPEPDIQETEQETVETLNLDNAVEDKNEVIDNIEDLESKHEAEKMVESDTKEAKTETDSEEIVENLIQEEAFADEFHDAEDSDHPTEIGPQGDNTTESPLQPTIAEENIAADQEDEIAEEFQDAEDDDAVTQHDEQNDVVNDAETSADIQNELGSESVDQEDKDSGPTETLQKEAIIPAIAIETANSEPVVAPILDVESRPENEIESGETEVAIKTPSINLTAPSTENLSHDLKEEESVTIEQPVEDTEEKEVLNENEPSRLPEQLSVAENADVPETKPQSRGLSKLISLFVKKAEEKIEEKAAHQDLGLSLAPAFEESKQVAENSDEFESMEVEPEIKPEETETQQKVSSTEAKETGIDEVGNTDANVEFDEKTITHAASPVIEEDQLEKVEEDAPQIVPATPKRQEVKKEHKTPSSARTPRTPRSARTHRTPKSARQSPIQRKTPQKKGAVSSPPVTRVLRNQTTENQGEIPVSHEGSEAIVPEALKREENLPETESEEQIGESTGVENAATNQGSPSKRTRSQAKVVEEEAVQEPSVESEKHAKEEDKTAVQPEDKNDALRSESKPETTAPKRKRGRPPKNRNNKIETNTNVAKKEEIPDLSPTASKTVISKSAPLKKRGKGIKPSTEEKDQAGNDEEHLKIPVAQDEDHPALRTRSRSPIKRSIQELSTEIDQAPQRKKRNLRQRNATKKLDDEEAQQEQEARGRTRKR